MSVTPPVSRLSPPPPEQWRIDLARSAYLVAAAACGALAGFMITGGAARMLLSRSGGLAETMSRVVSYVGGGFLLLLVCLFLFLTVRPYGWGNLICGACAAAWLMNGVFSRIMGSQDPGVAVVLACSAMMILAVLMHQVADRTLFQPYLRRDR